MSIEKARKELTTAIKEDSDFREGYKASIAMAFKDEYTRFKGEKPYLNSNDIHNMANKAADNFLNMWCK